jgi:hypothetical protein
MKYTTLRGTTSPSLPPGLLLAPRRWPTLFFAASQMQVETESARVALILIGMGRILFAKGVAGPSFSLASLAGDVKASLPRGRANACSAAPGETRAQMTKAELVDEVSRVVEMSRHDSEVIVEAILSSMVRALRSGERIEIRGSALSAASRNIQSLYMGPVPGCARQPRRAVSAR